MLADAGENRPRLLRADRQPELGEERGDRGKSGMLADHDTIGAAEQARIQRLIGALVLQQAVDVNTRFMGEDVLAEVPLPLGGLMSDLPIEEVRRQLDVALDAARELGSSLHDPFMAMSFLALEVIPSLKLTDQGLVDVDRFELVPLWVR